jgi:hypothetical protein
VTEHRDKVAPQIRSRRAHLNGHGASLRTVPLSPIADLYSDHRMMGPLPGLRLRRCQRTVTLPARLVAPLRGRGLAMLPLFCQAAATSAARAWLASIASNALGTKCYARVRNRHRTRDAMRMLPASGARQPAITFSASAATQPGRAVEELPRDVQMPDMPRRLLDHMQHNPTNIRWLEFTKPVRAQWWRRKGGCRQHRLGLRAREATAGLASTKVGEYGITYQPGGTTNGSEETFEEVNQEIIRTCEGRLPP